MTATVVVKATAAGIAHVIAEFLRTGDIDMLVSPRR
jgi:hypothetical protein